MEFQARILQQVAISSSRGTSQPRDQTCLLCLLHWQTKSFPLRYPYIQKDIKSDLSSHLCKVQLFLYGSKIVLWGGLNNNLSYSIVVVQSLSPVQLFATLWTAACQAPLSSIISWNLLSFTSVESVMLSNHLIFYHPLPVLLSIFSSIRIFPNELADHIRWPKYWSYNISPSSEYSGLISFRIDWFELLAVQETLKRLLQHHSSRVSVLWHSVFFMVQLSHSYMTTGKTIALTRWIFVGGVMSLLFDMLSRLVIA